MTDLTCENSLCRLATAAAASIDFSRPLHDVVIGQPPGTDKDLSLFYCSLQSAEGGCGLQGLYHSAGQYARKLLLKEEPPPSPRIDIAQTGLDPSKKAVFETVINAKAAAAIGLEVDTAALKNADLIIN